MHRHYPAWGHSARLIDLGGRNEFTEARAAYDDGAAFFCAITSKPIAEEMPLR